MVTNKDIEFIADKTRNPKLVSDKIVFLENNIEINIKNNKYNKKDYKVLNEEKTNSIDYNIAMNNRNNFMDKYSDINCFEYNQYYAIKSNNMKL